MAERRDAEGMMISPAEATPASQALQGRAKTRILILGGGFAGLYTARHLGRLLGRRSNVEVVLISRDNFFLMTPLLFEACSGILELRHCSVPVREFLHQTRFIEAMVREIDIDGHLVHAMAEGSVYEIAYNYLVLALGATTNLQQIPGSEEAFGFKTLADAILLRNHLIERFERADAETDPERRRRLLTFVVVGGGLVGVEIFGELTAFVDQIAHNYPRVSRQEARFFLLQATDRILPELEPAAAIYAEKVLTRRPGVQIRTNSPVLKIEPDRLHLRDEIIEADTIVLAAGVVASPLVQQLPLEKGKNGRVKVDATMRSTSHPEVWALGDCAQIPGPDGKPYPYLAQHAMREGKTLARNLVAALQGKAGQPFLYRMLGLMASLGHHKAFAQVIGLRLHGFIAWWVRRTYYLFVMPRWGRRIRIVFDWTIALMFAPDTVKVDLDREVRQMTRGPAGSTELQLLPPPSARLGIANRASNP